MYPSSPRLEFLRKCPRASRCVGGHYLEGLGEKSSLQLKGFTHLENGGITFPTWILGLGLCQGP